MFRTTTVLFMIVSSTVLHGGPLTLQSHVKPLYSCEHLNLLQFNPNIESGKDVRKNKSDCATTSTCEETLEPKKGVNVESHSSKDASLNHLVDDAC
ncbi:hypothetical protein COLO4_19907 [Corchorus olitorius]|uniref:Uncharacterized protein n=1 Tax=Corchorus olitorius TaxID=93759 RepID=A0A1R3J311_9ROSI|nr:hypothetical protein COLO4_19907 [Corchorus olitorius]